MLAMAAISIAACHGGRERSSSIATLSSDEQQVLALAAPPAERHASQAVVHQQSRVRLLPKETDEWVALGRAWMRVARESHDSGFGLNARASAEIAAGLAPEATGPRALEASVLLDEHRFGEARELALDVLRTSKDDETALSVACDASLELGRFDEAVELTQRLADQKPGLAASSRIAWIRWLAGDVPGSLTALAEAESMGSPRDPQPLAWCLAQDAHVRWLSGDLVGARAAATNALRLDGRQVQALVTNARVALAESHPREALAALDAARAVFPSAEIAWLRGDAHHAAGDETSASASWDEAVLRGRQGDRRTLGLFLSTKNRDGAEAVTALEAERAGRGEPITMDALAWALYRTSRLVEARAASDDATRHGTLDPTFLYHRGAILIAQGEREEGERLVRQALAINPAFDATGAGEARALVEPATRRASR